MKHICGSFINQAKYLFSRSYRLITGEYRLRGTARIALGMKTDVGDRQGKNEDSLGVFQTRDQTAVIGVVSDGMGGLTYGAVSSGIAIGQVREAIRGNSVPEIKAESLTQMVQNAHDKILEVVKVPGSMGATISAVLIDYTGKMLYVHVGDSRIYINSGDSIRQITLDHSVAWRDFVETGKLSKESVRTLEDNRRLYNYLGMQHDELRIDVGMEQLKPNESVIICSDGLTDVVDDNLVQEIINACGPRKATSKLIKKVKEMSRDTEADNISVIVMRYMHGMNENQKEQVPDTLGG